PHPDAPTIITPPSGRTAGFLYCNGVRLATFTGKPALADGIEARLQAPVAITSLRQRHGPWLVSTSKPPSFCLTCVTRVPVLIGAPKRLAYRCRKRTTSGIIIKPSGSSPV